MFLLKINFLELAWSTVQKMYNQILALVFLGLKLVKLRSRPTSTLMVRLESHSLSYRTPAVKKIA